MTESISIKFQNGETLNVTLKKLFSIFIFVMYFTQIHAATIVVDTHIDEVSTPTGKPICRLRDAIIAANTDTSVGACVAGDAGHDIIELKNGTYTIFSDLPRITDSLSIIGKGKDHTFVSSDLSAEFDERAHLIYFHPQDYTGKTLLLKALYLSSGTKRNATQGGGCMNVKGSHTVTLDHIDMVSCSHNVSTTVGGGLYFESSSNVTPNVGILNILWSEIRYNNVQDNLAKGVWGRGGGIATMGAMKINIKNSLITGNIAKRGAGIDMSFIENDFNLTSDLNITRSVISYNKANSRDPASVATYGGGIYLTACYEGATQNIIDVKIKHSNINSNRSVSFSGDAAGIYACGPNVSVDLENTYLANNVVSETSSTFFNADFYFVSHALATTSGYNAIGFGTSIFGNQSWSLEEAQSPNSNNDYTKVTTTNYLAWRDKGNCPNEPYDYEGKGLSGGVSSTRAVNDPSSDDGKGDNCDIGAYEFASIPVLDYDGDGVLDVNDVFPSDSTEAIDTDGDHIGNNADLDDDGDRVLDGTDAFPLDATESLDTDNDGVGNNADLDDDDDNILDVNDAFPLDASESVDTDGDGTGNNEDLDDDNDGYLDVIELSEGSDPLDASSKPLDTDGDFIPNSTDTDDDNDGISDVYEISLGFDPLDASSKPLDTDGDGTPNALDADDDNDGISDSDEATLGFNPLNASDGLADTDGDGFSNAMEFNIGTNMNDAADKPIWVPIMMDNIMIFVPSKG